MSKTPLLLLVLAACLSMIFLRTPPSWGESEHEQEYSDQNDDGSSVAKPESPGKKKGRPKPVCRRPGQKNCRLPVCRRPNQRNCRLVHPAKTPTPAATPVGKPNPTPTVPSSGGSFDQNGNTVKFGIPSGLTGNISRGRGIWTADCGGCHGSEKLGRTYSQIKSALNLGAMSGVKVTNQEVADLIAYLNRFNP